jgi:hypothetical protein
MPYRPRSRLYIQKVRRRQDLHHPAGAGDSYPHRRNRQGCRIDPGRASTFRKIGDGKIFITPLEQVIRIRTGETGKDAV